MRKIFICGHNGMVGSAICRQLQQQPDVEILTRTRAELDLCDQAAVLEFMRSERPDEVILAAAKVGGIHANNTYPAEFIYQNLQIQNNVIHAAHLKDVQKLLFLGSSCIYPRHAPQPMRESYNRQYGRDYRSVMPTNLYGPGDNYHPDNSHVVPALIRRFHEAKARNSSEVVIWGSGTAKREFLYVDDMAEASLFVHTLHSDIFSEQTQPMLSHVNIGTGADVTIRDLADTVKEVVGFTGNLVFDTSKPDGAPRKLMDVDLLTNLGWTASVGLRDGLRHSYQDFLNNQNIRCR